MPLHAAFAHTIPQSDEFQKKDPRCASLALAVGQRMERPFGIAVKKGRLDGYPVSFFNAYEVSCRARAEEAGPTPLPATRPNSGFPRCWASCGRLCTRRCMYAVVLRFRQRVYYSSLAPVKLALLVDDG